MSENKLKSKIHTIIFEADTKSGKVFDILLIALILISVVVVLFDSVSIYNEKYGELFWSLEWFFTIVFTIEYLFRLYSVKKPYKYVSSFFGIIDLLAILPTYLSLFLPGSQLLLVIRVLRVLRIFRVLKLIRFLKAAMILKEALSASRTKIVVFLMTVSTLVIIFGSMMYLIEGTENGFTSIPRSIYWAIVTLTTVGYGDLSPQTNIGQVLASIIMIMGYAIIAVPTGIVTTEIAKREIKRISTQACPECSAEGHDADAVYCKYCGAKL